MELASPDKDPSPNKSRGGASSSSHPKNKHAVPSMSNHQQPLAAHPVAAGHTQGSSRKPRASGANWKRAVDADVAALGGRGVGVDSSGKKSVKEEMLDFYHQQYTHQRRATGASAEDDTASAYDE